jgi:site-specific recombinase XerD
MFDDRIQALAITLQPSTLAGYRNASRDFLSFLQTEFPELRQLSELRRHPHLLGWFRHLCQKDPPLNSGTRANYLFKLRRLLHEFDAQGYSLHGALIFPEDFPACPQYLPRALSSEDDQRLQQELRRTNDLPSTALLLTRATGIRIGECIHLAADCLRSVGPDQWALHVPLGKLHTERLVPVDQEVCQMVARILALRSPARPPRSIASLLPCPGSPNTVYDTLRETLNAAAQRAGCPHVTCHQLRHTYASEMIRLGVSLPVLMQLLGHKDIRMTMRYVQITQRDLQREFHLARQNAVQHHHIPHISTPSSPASDLPGICHALAATRHLLEMYRRQLQDEKASRKLQRLDRRLLSVASELDRLGIAQK